MREQGRALRLIVLAAVRADWKRSLGTLLEPLGKAAVPLTGLWLALLVNGVIRRDTALIGIGAGAMAACQSLNLAAQLYGTSMRLSLSEAVGHWFDRQIATLTATLPGLEHHERPEYQDRLELLRQAQGVLGQSLNALVNAAGGVVVALITLGLLASADPLLLLLAVFGLPSIWLSRAGQRWRRRGEEASAPSRRLARHFQGLMTDHGAGAELRVCRLEGEVIARHRAAWLSSGALDVRASRRQAAVSTAERLAFAAGFAGAVAFTLWRAASGQASAGEVLLVIVVGGQVEQYVLGSVYSVAELGTALRAAERFLWLADYAREAGASWPGHRAAPAALRQGIELDGVSFRYPGSETPTLRDVLLRIPAGSVVAVVGENGAGKTSLVKLLCGFYRPVAGRILVDGTDLADIDVGSWRGRVTAAFQDFARFELVARQSAGVGDLPRADSGDAVLGAMERAGASDVVAALPRGLATQLGAGWDGGVELSVGQWQKLALGRALMREAPLVAFFDEPTASLDAPTEHALFERYARAARAGRERGMITVLVSHRFSTVRMADLILVLKDGRLVEQGTHGELVRAGGHYAQLYDLQARWYALPGPAGSPTPLAGLRIQTDPYVNCLTDRPMVRGDTEENAGRLRRLPCCPRKTTRS